MSLFTAGSPTVKLLCRYIPCQQGNKTVTTDCHCHVGVLLQHKMCEGNQQEKGNHSSRLLHTKRKTCFKDTLLILVFAVHKVYRGAV